MITHTPCIFSHAASRVRSARWTLHGVLALLNPLLRHVFMYASSCLTVSCVHLACSILSKCSLPELGAVVREKLIADLYG